VADFQLKGIPAMIWIELLVVLACIFLGARFGGIALGTIAAIGLAVLVFAFGLTPGMPPRTVLGMILAVITAAASMQAAGGMDYLVVIAERVLRVRPKGITLVSAVVAYIFTFMAGTTHVIYALLPVIAEVSRKAGVRPERPLSIATIASQQAVTASPISAATVALLGLLSGAGIRLEQILLISIPSTFLGSILGALAVMWKGEELDQDPTYKERLEKGAFEEPVASAVPDSKQLRNARGSVIVFLVAVVLVVMLGLVPALRPSHPVLANGEEALEQLEMAPAIMIIMLAAAGINTLLFRASPAAAVKGSLMNAGVVALISIAGLGWLGSSFFEGNRAMIIDSISAVVQQYPWIFAVGLFVLSILLSSQAAAVVTLMPVGLGLGLGIPAIIAMFPAVNGSFFLPTRPTSLAAISFDRTGTTRIGKYVLNHSFMLPGMVTTISSTVIGFLIASIVF
jgi:anaerobic C4-dicarboxylate transporter DcuA